METITPLKAIKAKCLDCCGYNKTEVRNCSATDCPLYLFRKGHRQKRKAVADDIDSVDPDKEEAHTDMTDAG